MSWFDTTGLASLAKTALKEAQKQIDKALDIEEKQTEEKLTTSTKRPRKSPGGANRTDTTDIPTADELPRTLVKDEAVNTATAAAEGSAPSWGSFTGSFFDNPYAHEMVTTPPKSNAMPEVASTSSLKRPSVTSHSDSVELLSSPPTTPCSEGLTSPSAAAVTSDSVELLTATSSSAISPDTCSLPESIVIIASSPLDEEDDTVSFNTVMDYALDNYTVAPKSSGEEPARVHLSSLDADTPRGISAELGQSDSSSGTLKLLMSMEETQTVDTDSTQSFEDIQMQTSDLQSFSSKDPVLTLTTDDKLDLIKSASQSYGSPHNSNDEMETATSSDIEIISNPNGDSSSTNSATRTSPLKSKQQTSQQEGTTTSQSTVIVTKKGHFREPSEISIISESESQSELDKLVQRLTELNEILEAREVRLLQAEREKSELLERNSDLQSAMNAMKSNSMLDSAEEYTQRLSALEKKFQASIRERDSMRIEMKTLKEELQRKIPKDNLTQVVAESNAMIAELQQEGEKLSKEILQQSNIIKKLRAKEKTSDVLLKKNKEQISVQLDELERLKKTLNAKEDVERSQIEAVHKMSAEKRKLDEEKAQNQSKIEDLESKLSTLQASFDGAKAELLQRTRQQSDLTRTAEEAQAAHKEKELTKARNLEMGLQINQLQERLRSAEQAMTKREQQLREDNKQLMSRLEAAELRVENSTQEVSLTTIPLMRQLESLQNTLSQRTSNWNKEERMLLEKLEFTQNRLKSLENVEASFKEKLDLLQARCIGLEEKLSHALMHEEELKITLQQVEMEISVKESNLNRQITLLTEQLNERATKLKSLEETNKNLEHSIQAKIHDSAIADEYVHRELSSAALNEVARLEQQRPHSPAVSCGINSLEDAMGGSVDWQADDIDCISNSGRQASVLAYGMPFNFMGHNTTTLEHLQSLLKQRDGELSHLQWELSRLQAERAAINEDISNLTLELENAKEKLQSSESMEKNFADLQHRYDALLQMFGEKVERTQELELDLVELKEAYKLQIDELLAQPRPST